MTMVTGTGNGAASTGSNPERGENQQGQQTDQLQSAPEQVTMSKEEYERSLQSETDKRVTEALKTAKKKWEKEFSERVEREREEAARMSQLSERERQELLLKKREETLALKERELSRQRLQLETIKVLEERKLPVRFADWLIGEDGDTTFNNVKAFEEAFKEAVNDEIKRRIPQITPRVGSGTNISPGNAFDSMIRRAAGRKR